MVYAGGAEDRQAIQKHDLYFNEANAGRRRRVKPNIVLSSYETVLRDKGLFQVGGRVGGCWDWWGGGCRAPLPAVFEASPMLTTSQVVVVLPLGPPLTPPQYGLIFSSSDYISSPGSQQDS